MFKRENRVYIFDWDNNIMEMPTKILMEKRVGEKWVREDVSTEKYAKVRNGDDYRLISETDPFIKFEHDNEFFQDLSIAINDQKYGPSYLKFKEALMYGHDFAIVTARGHKIDTFITGIMSLINKTFTIEEKVFCSKSIMTRCKCSILDFLKKQEYWAVNSPDFHTIHYPHLTINDPTELRKTLVVEDYINRKINTVKEIDVMAKLSIGFSDDDKKNVLAITEFIKNKLKGEHKNVHFVVYDTSNPDNIVKNPIM
jgi:hypothetical protein